MKLSSILFVSSCVVVSAFGVNPSPGLSTAASKAAISPAFRTTTSLDSPLFRDVNKVRGGAVPGWAAYNDALDKKPLVTKAMTSLVGWGLGDILAQVSTVERDSHTGIGVSGNDGQCSCSWSSILCVYMKGDLCFFEGSIHV